MKREELEKEAIETYREISTEQKEKFFIALIQSIPTDLLETLRNKGE